MIRKLLTPRLGLPALAAAALVAIALSNWSGSNPIEAQAAPPECGADNLGSVSAEQVFRCLEIVKETNPGGSSQDFTFDVVVNPPTGPDQNDSFDLQDGDVAGYDLATANTSYSITEEETAGWQLVDINCDDNDGFDVTYDMANNSVIMEYTGQIVGQAAFGVCVFTNERIETPTVTRTATSTATQTPTVTTTPEAATPTVTATPRRPNVGGIFDPGAIDTPTKVPTAVAPTKAPSGVKPPNTGDGGLR
jgi:hypothetical protein